MFCPSCDKEMSSEEANYCHHCGSEKVGFRFHRGITCNCVFVSVELRSILTTWKPNNDF